MDVVSIVASITTLVALTKEIVIVAGTLLRDVHDAPKELVLVSNHVSLISLEFDCINRVHGLTDLGVFLTMEESLILKKSLTIVKNDMVALQRECEKYTKGGARVSSRISWALFDSKTVNKCLEQLHKIESHLHLISNIMQLQGSIRGQHESANQAALVLQELKAYHEQVLRQNKPPHDSSQAAISMTDTESSITFQHRYTFAFSDYWKCILGGDLRFSKAQNDFQNAYEFYARVPLPSYPSKMALVLSFSIRRLLGLLPNISILGGGLNFVNMVPEDSEIVIACEKGDTLAVRDLFRQKKGAPNDMTVQDKALLYYAARSGSVELVRFLINAGAPVQPNQLLAASYWRQPGTARLLLLAGANVEVLAYNGFTAASYLYGSARPKVSQTEFIEILANNSFSNFNTQDKDGWTALHRASAWGTSADVRVLVQMKASIQRRTSKLDWTPLFVAVCYRNLESLQELWNCQDDANFKDQQDFRGWNLLHMAARYGNFDAVPFLIERGVNLGAKSKATSRSVPYTLRGRCVTPNEVARCCGEEAYGKWAQALRVVGREVDVRTEDIDWSVEDVVESFGCCECCSNWNSSMVDDVGERSIL